MFCTVLPGPGDLLAIELLGPHNAAINTQRPLGPARIKWRLLAARGYRVIVINTWQWQNSRGRLSAVARSQEAGLSVSNIVDNSVSDSLSVSETAGSVRVSTELVAFLQGRLLAAGAAAGSVQQQQQMLGDGADGGDDATSSSSRSKFSALERPIRRPGAWR